MLAQRLFEFNLGPDAVRPWFPADTGPRRTHHFVVVHNTSPTAEVRAPLIALGKQYGCPIIGYYFPPDVAASLKRNAGREGKAKVPPVAIYATRKKLQPPSYAEGFDALYSVRIAEDGGFQVQPLVEEAVDD